jgi:3-deoxy-manno-octulosonate cytidylyltransferase (CMP-KDO synthetase)
MLERAIVVPARLGSQRFPKKLLHEIRGRPLILWTADNLQRIALEIPLFFAVAESELADLLTEAGHKCLMTDPDLPSGTDRIAVANREIGARQVINVQADEPVLQAEHLSGLFEMLEAGADVATVATVFDDEADFRDPNKVKAVVGMNRRALYFSRAPVPYLRDRGGALPESAYWHMGVYAYSAAVLERFLSWPPSPLETIERLEQLRVLENGGRIDVAIKQSRTVGVDVPEDLEQLEPFLPPSDL